LRLRRPASDEFPLAQRVYIINNGHIAHEGPAEEIKVRPEILQRHLGV
jgi:branched-chain amino acid transport system ATP-binding protein